MMASVVHADRAAYASSKGGLVQLTRVLAVEWAPFNVRVNAICPGPFLTDLNKPILDDPEKVKYFMDRLPMQAIWKAGRARRIGHLPGLRGVQLHHGDHPLYRRRLDGPVIGSGKPAGLEKGEP